MIHFIEKSTCCTQLSVTQDSQHSDVFLGKCSPHLAIVHSAGFAMVLVTWHFLEHVAMMFYVMVRVRWARLAEA